MTPPHLAPWLADYASGRLEERCEHEIEAHFLVCDVCFAAYLSHVLQDCADDAVESPA